MSCKWCSRAMLARRWQAATTCSCQTIRMLFPAAPDTSQLPIPPCRNRLRTGRATRSATAKWRGHFVICPVAGPGWLMQAGSVRRSRVRCKSARPPYVPQYVPQYVGRGRVPTIGVKPQPLRFACRYRHRLHCNESCHRIYGVPPPWLHPNRRGNG